MLCAIKILSKEKLFMHQSRIDNLINELYVLESIMHPNLTRIYELVHDNENIYIVQEIVRQGDLFKFLETRNEGKGRLTEKEVSVLAKQLFTALNYLH